MSSRSLPNHYSSMSADVDPRAPSSQMIKSDMGPYPGGMPNMTPAYMNNDKRVNKSVGLGTNGSVRTTVQTRTRDQNYVNINQIAFIDTKIPDRPLLMNIQQLNWWFIEHGTDVLRQPRVLNEWIVTNKKNVALNEEQAEKAYIMKRFKLYGAVVNRDIDNNDSMPMERQPRAFTCTVKGVCHLLDYWSTADRSLHAYDQCYFVLKKVLVGPHSTFQSRLTTSVHNSGSPVPASWPKLGQMVWQIVPWHTSDNYIPVSVYSWTDSNLVGSTLVKGKSHVGGHWRIGNVHEYPDIGHRSSFKKRGELSVAQDITYLHDGGRVVPIHFYLKLDSNCN
jgi:hypothetical protein